MSKQDVNAVRTAQDLEIKYDLSSIAGLKKNYEIQKQGLTKVENELNDFVNATTKDIEEIKNQVDGNITTWFSSGIPTLENYPASEWPSETEKSNHLGDLYYDQDTGYAYRFIQKDGTFSWLRITDSDVTEALAIANAAKDTADRKRQVFVVQPKPPYDVGDLWIRDEEIYRCQTSRPDGEIFEDNDWIKATKYTDDTVANQVDGKLTILSGTVTEIKQNVDELKTTMTNTTKVVDEQGNTIGTLQEKQSETTQTVNGITTKVSSVETDLNTTKTNLSNLSDKVNTLSDDIDGVSADFEDFKDNEYIQSIDNLQKQIDGAIQFWNGAEIPKPNSSDLITYNYPANQWTTENDKINHQADIYTVVQDVQGEMKQGKSYRFDKVNGVWQWIELTDNELSAVQAIAQEALNKANANATEIGTVKTRVSSLEQTDEQIKASVESIDKQIIPTATTTGIDIHIEDASDNPLVQLEIEGKSEQTTRNGKNKFNKDLYTYEYVTQNSTSDVGGYKTIPIYVGKANTNYYVSTNFLNGYTPYGKTLLWVLITNLSGDINEWVGIGHRDFRPTDTQFYNNTITSDENGYLYLRVNNNTSKAIYDELMSNIKTQIEEGTVKTSYEEFGVIPSPDFPSEIKSVGYENLLDLENISIGWATDNSNFLKILNSLDVGTYTLILNFVVETISNSTNNNVFGAILINSSLNIDCRTTINTTLKIGEVYTSKRIIEITEDNKGKFTASYLYGAGNDDIGQTATSKTQNCILTKGTQEHSYIPYGKYGIEVEIVGKNLCYSSVPNGNNASLYVYAKSIKSKTLTISLIPDISYINNTIYGYIVGVEGLGGLGTITCDANTKGNATITLSDSVYSSIQKGNIVEFRIYKGDGTVSSIKEAQVELGNNATDYEPYQSNTSLIVLNEPLRSLPNGVKDIAYIRNNKLYVDRYVGSVVLNGDESIFTYEFNGMNGVQISNIFSENLVRASGVSNYSLQVGTYYSSNSIWCGVASKHIYWIGILDELGLSTADELKTWLSTNNVQVDYQLAEPYTEEICEIDMPSTFKGVNHISTTDSLEPTINVEYVRDTTLSSYVEEQINNVMTIQNRKIGELIVRDDEITQRVSATETNLNNNYMTTDQINAQTDSLKKDIDYNTTKMTELSTTIDGVNIKIQTMGAKIENMNYSFQTDALKISTSESKINSKFDNTGVKVYNYELLMAIFNHRGTGVGDLIVTGTAQVCYLKFMKSTKNGKPITAIHHIISEIQTLEDLESDE